MQPLLEDLAVGDQPAPVTDRPHQGIHGALGDWPAGALAQQPHQRRAVAIVGLVAPRAELGSGRLGLRRREQPHRSGPASFQLGDPGPVQPTGRLHADYWWTGHLAGSDQPGQGVDALAQHRLPDQPALATGHPDPAAHLARVDRHDQRRHGDRLAQQLHHQPPPYQPQGTSLLGEVPHNARWLKSYQLTKGAPDRGREHESSAQATVAISPTSHSGRRYAWSGEGRRLARLTLPMVGRPREAGGLRAWRTTPFATCRWPG